MVEDCAVTPTYYAKYHGTMKPLVTHLFRGLAQPICGAPGPGESVAIISVTSAVRLRSWNRAPGIQIHRLRTGEVGAVGYASATG